MDTEPIQNLVSAVIFLFENLFSVPFAASQTVFPFFVTSTTPLKPVPSSIALRYACFSFVPQEASIVIAIAAASSRAIARFIFHSSFSFGYMKQEHSLFDTLIVLYNIKYYKSVTST